MTIAVIPNTSAADTHGAFAILALLQNGDEYAKKLAELVSERQAAVDAIKQSEEHFANAKVLAGNIAEREARVSEREASVREREIAVESAKSNHDLEVAEHAREVDRHDDSVKEVMDDLRQREFKISAAERTLTAKLAEADMASRQATHLKSTYEQKLAELRKLAGA